MFPRMLFLVAIAVFLAPIPASSQDQVEASGKRINSGELKDADIIGTFTSEELLARLDAQKQCKNETLLARTDGTSVFLDGGDFAVEEFGEALAHRYKLKPFYCVEIVGPGHNVRLVTSYLRHLKDTEVVSINWVSE